MLEEIQDAAEPVTIVLKFLDENLHYTSNRWTLNRRELRYVSELTTGSKRFT